MDRKELGELFYIEDHAALYGFLCKAAEEACGEAGLSACEKATALYGKERGLRMAMRALGDNCELTPKNYLAYGEWIDTEKWSQSELVSCAPEYRFNVTKCGWNDSWHKHGLTKYGKIYCSVVDVSLAFGFNPEMVLDMNMYLSHGHDKCNFHWVDTGFTDENDMKQNAARQAEMSERTVKDFLYHTGHLLSALRRAFYYELGLVNGRKAVEQGLSEYAGVFGEAKKNAVLAEAEQDFLKI